LNLLCGSRVAVELSEEDRQEFFIHTKARIGDFDKDCFLLFGNRDLDPTGFGVLERVIKEVLDDLTKGVGINRHFKGRGGRREGDINVLLLLGDEREVARDAANKFDDILLFKVVVHVSLFDFAQVEEGVDHVYRTIGRVFYFKHSLVYLRRFLVGAVVDEGGELLNECDRGLEVMTSEREELVLLLVERPELIIRARKLF